MGLTRGVASWYGPGFDGRLTASRKRFDQWALTCAHRTLPFGTVVYATNPVTGIGVYLLVNDRGPYVRGRMFDLSAGAARALGITEDGVAELTFLVLKEP